MSLCGYIGLAPKDGSQGDAIVVLFGGAVPFTIRKELKHYYTFIGEWHVSLFCYDFRSLSGFFNKVMCTA